MSASSRQDAVAKALIANGRGENKSPTWIPLVSSSLHGAARVETGRHTYFCKWAQTPLPRAFESEAAGLLALREALAAHSSLGHDPDVSVPEVIAWNDESAERNFLLLEWIESGAPGDDYDARLARGLAIVHGHSSPQFGFDLDGYCGRTPQPNPWSESWPRFYRDQRLGFQFARAAERGLPSSTQRKIAMVLDQVESRLGSTDEGAVLIHGDLWSGNAMSDEHGRPVLVDPAAYFAHREAELGMMRLYGNFSRDVYAHYDEVLPLADGWQARLPLYILYHVLNHFNLFGGGYAAQADQLASQLLKD